MEVYINVGLAIEARQNKQVPQFGAKQNFHGSQALAHF